MKDFKEGMPRDRRLIQESLKEVSKGPKALMEWASKHYDEIDQEFINLLRKMITYAKEHGENELHKTFEFLDTCFCKMFDFNEISGTIAVTEENCKEHINKALGFLKVGKARESLQIFRAVSMFLKHNPKLPYHGIVHANMGIAYAQLNLKEKAIDRLIEAQKYELNDTEKGKLFGNMATIYRDLGQYTEASVACETGLEIAKKREDKEMEIVHLNNMALIKLDIKELEESYLIQQNAYKLAKDLGYEKVIQDCTTRLAMLTALRGDTKKCEKLCKEGLASIEKTGKNS